MLMFDINQIEFIYDKISISYACFHVHITEKGFPKWETLLLKQQKYINAIFSKTIKIPFLNRYIIF